MSYTHKKISNGLKELHVKKSIYYKKEMHNNGVFLQSQGRKERIK